MTGWMRFGDDIPFAGRSTRNLSAGWSYSSDAPEGVSGEGDTMGVVGGQGPARMPAATRAREFILATQRAEAAARGIPLGRFQRRAAARKRRLRRARRIARFQGA